MRKLKVCVLLAIVCLALAGTNLLAAADMTCVAGMAFRGRDGQLLDCFADLGNDCEYCSAIIVVQG